MLLYLPLNRSPLAPSKARAKRMYNIIQTMMRILVYLLLMRSYSQEEKKLNFFKSVFPITVPIKGRWLPAYLLLSFFKL
jgi:hypothetical protein